MKKNRLLVIIVPCSEHIDFNEADRDYIQTIYDRDVEEAIDHFQLTCRNCHGCHFTRGKCRPKIINTPAGSWPILVRTVTCNDCHRTATVLASYMIPYRHEIIPEAVALCEQIEKLEQNIDQADTEISDTEKKIEDFTLKIIDDSFRLSKAKEALSAAESNIVAINQTDPDSDTGKEEQEKLSSVKLEVHEARYQLEEDRKMRSSLKRKRSALTRERNKSRTELRFIASRYHFFYLGVHCVITIKRRWKKMYGEFLHHEAQYNPEIFQQEMLIHTCCLEGLNRYFLQPV